MNEENLITYYNKFNEDKRLKTRHGRVEYLTAMKYIEKYLKKFKNPKILDIGAGCGAYSIPLSKKGQVTAVELVSGPTQKEFIIGTAFDFSGAQVKVSYDNNTSEIIDVTNEMTTGGNINHISSQTITVNCGGKTVTFDVKVIPASISSIEITNLPSKLEYMEETLELFKEKYENIEKYFNYLGFTSNDIDKIKNKLI